MPSVRVRPHRVAACALLLVAFIFYTCFVHETIFPSPAPAVSNVSLKPADAYNQNDRKPPLGVNQNENDPFKKSYADVDEEDDEEEDEEELPQPDQQILMPGPTKVTRAHRVNAFPHARQTLTPRLALAQSTLPAHLPNASQACVTARSRRPAFIICLHDSTADKWVSAGWRARGTWEDSVGTILQRTVQQHKFDQVTVINVGAHIGSHALYARALDARVLAVEPLPANQQLLRLSALQNGWPLEQIELTGETLPEDDQLRLRDRQFISIANIVSSERRQRSIIVDPSSIAGSHLLHKTYVDSRRSDIVTVQAVLLDDLLQIIRPGERASRLLRCFLIDKTSIIARGISVLLIVDAESHDCHVVNGGRRLLQLPNMLHIVMEWGYHGTMNAHCVQAMLDMLGEMHFVPHRLKELTKINYLNPHAHDLKANIIWIKDDAALNKTRPVKAVPVENGITGKS